MPWLRWMSDPRSRAIDPTRGFVLWTVRFWAFVVGLSCNPAKATVSVPIPSSKKAMTLPAPMINPMNTAATTLRSCRRVFTLLARYINDVKYRRWRQNYNIVRYSDTEFINDTSNDQAR